MEPEDKSDLGGRVVVRASNDKAEWEEVVRLTNAEGWNESLADLEVYFKCFPGSLLVALLDGKPVGFTAVVKWSNDFAAGGLSIVNNVYRGRGIGKALWKQRFKNVADVMNFSITSIAHRIEPNMRLGFETVIGKISLVQGNVAKMSLEAPKMADGIRVFPYEETALDDVAAYDDTIHKVCSRGEFLKCALTKEGMRAFVARKGRQVVGYGGIHPVFDGYRLTPLYADSNDVAFGLFHALVHSLPDDLPKLTMFLIEGSLGEWLARKVQLDKLFSGMGMMIKGEGFTVSWERVYGTFGAEFTYV